MIIFGYLVIVSVIVQFVNSLILFSLKESIDIGFLNMPSYGLKFLKLIRYKMTFYKNSKLYNKLKLVYILYLTSLYLGLILILYAFYFVCAIKYNLPIY